MNPPSAVDRVRAMIFGPWVAASLYAAAELRIADLLAQGPRSAEELATAAGVKPDPLRRVLRALVAHGVFVECEDGRFKQSELSDLLRDDIAGTLRPTVLLYGGRALWAPWSQILHTIRTGETAFSKVHGAELFDYFGEHEEDARIFNRAMTQGSAAVAEDIVRAYDFGRFHTIVDVGGGQGLLLARILGAFRGARGILFDLPQVMEGARAVLAKQGVADRCTLVGGSFFDAVPAGGDGYVMKWILHDWDDAACTKILRNVRAVIPLDGRLVVVERVMPERVADDAPVRFGLLMDVNMLVNLAGRERTEEEFRRLFEASGFRLTSARGTGTGLGIVEGVPA